MDVLDLCQGMDIVNTLPEYTKPKNARLMTKACRTARETLRLCGQELPPAGRRLKYVRSILAYSPQIGYNRSQMQKRSPAGTIERAVTPPPVFRRGGQPYEKRRNRHA